MKKVFDSNPFSFFNMFWVFVPEFVLRVVKISSETKKCILFRLIKSKTKPNSNAESAPNAHATATKSNTTLRQC